MSRFKTDWLSWDGPGARALGDSYDLVLAAVGRQEYREMPVEQARRRI